LLPGVRPPGAGWNQAEAAAAALAQVRWRPRSQGSAPQQQDVTATHDCLCCAGCGALQQ
jgi:hypothetical protein